MSVLPDVSTPSGTSVDDRLARLLDRAAVLDTVHGFAARADRRDWVGLRRLFADEVFVDYTSRVGGVPGTVPGDGLIAGWAAALGGLTATQHMIAGEVVDFERPSPGEPAEYASVDAYFQANHILANLTGGTRWELSGRYAFGLRRVGPQWLIDRLVMTVMWADGNEKIMDLAAATVAR